MEKRGLNDPNQTLHEIYFQKKKVVDDSESEPEEKPRVYKVLKAYHDVVKAQGKGNQIVTEKISAGQLATN